MGLDHRDHQEYWGRALKRIAIRTLEYITRGFQPPVGLTEEQRLAWYVWMARTWH